MAEKQSEDATDTVARVLRNFDEDKKSHAVFARKVDQWYRAYRGVMEVRSKAATWNNKETPAYILQIIETMIASSLDPNPQWKIKARPRMLDEQAILAEIQGARAMELLLAEQTDVDHFAEKQRPFAMQMFIAGLTVNKNYWRYSAGTRKSLGQKFRGVPGTALGITTLAEVEGAHIYHDNPTMDVVDVRDFIWHQAAPSLEKAMRVTHRVWMSMDELRQLEAAGVYENVGLLTDTQDFTGEIVGREQDLFQTSRAKNQVEVLEQWFYDKGGIWVATVGNRTVCLTPGGKAKPNPFWHGGYPFVVTSSMPDLFRIPGISEVETIAKLQEMLWTLMNQRLDNLQLLNNAISIIRSDVDDPDAYIFAPGERWLVDDINQVKFLETPPITAELALGAEAGIKSDLQNISGGLPMLSGDSSNLDNQTATGASIFTTLAQRRVAAKKQNLTWAYNRTGEQWIALNQQFIREDRFVEIVGAEGAGAVRRISPLEIQGRFHIRGEMLDESITKQQRLAEAQARLQVAVAAALPFAQTGTPLNLKAYMDDYLKEAGVQDTERYYAAQNPLPNMQQGQPQQGQTAGPAAGPEGVTAPQAIDANAPSNAFSQSPVAAEQRLGAMAGGPVNS